MNCVIMMGRLTKDPEIRYTQNGGMAIASLSIAVDRRIKRDNAPDADFFNCTAFGKTAEFVEKYLFKGIKIVLQGRIENEQYEKDGQKKTATKIMIETIELAESKKAMESAETSEPVMNTPTGLEVELPFV